VSIRDVVNWDGDLDELLFNRRVGDAVCGSLLLAFSTGICGALIGVPAAYFLARYRLPMQKLWIVVLTLPLVFPSYISAYSYLAAFGRMGFFQDIFGTAFPLKVRGSLFGAWLSMVMVNFPFVFLMTYSSLQNLPASIEESALSLGCSRRQVFFKVILPNLKVPVVSGMLIIALYSLSDFGTPAIMNYRTLTFEIFKFWDTGRLPQASAFALVLILLAFAILVLEGVINRRSHFLINNKNCRTAPRSELPAGAKTLVMLFFSMVCFTSLLLPLGTILYWAAKGRDSFHFDERLQAAVGNSLTLAVLTALCCLLFALPFAWFAGREKGPLAVAADKTSFIGNMLPGVVIALAMVSFFIHFQIGELTIYHSLAMPVLGCSLRFLPQAVSALKSSLVQINPRLEEAAINLGHSPLQALKAVTVPLIRPGILSALTLVFITTIKELPITYMLSPPGKRYLTQEIWDYVDDAEYSQVAVPALFLLTISALSLFFTLKQNKKAEHEQ
jgi:iron(III) transport system permease protein